MSSVRKETASGIKWGMIQRLTVQPVQFVYAMVLARLITPEEMGILGLTAIFFAVASQLQNCGFGAALIRKQDRTEVDCSTAFWFNAAASCVLSLALFMAAQWFAVFFHQPALVNLTRVSALLMFLGSFQSVHLTLYSARREFKVPAIVGVISTLVPMPFTLWAAWSGWSYWSLMVQSALSTFLNLLIIWILSPWRPRFIFSLISFRELFAFGVNLTGTGIVTLIYDHSRTFVIGKFYSVSQLALFSRAFQLCNMPMQLIMGTLMAASYPVLSTLQDDEKRLNSVYRKYVRFVCMPIQWIMLTMAASSHSLIVTLYGERWAGAADYCQLICLGCMLTPVSSLNGIFMQVRGHAEMLLRREVIVRIGGLSFLAVGACHSVMGICVATMCGCVFSLIISMWLTSRISSITPMQQMQDFLPFMLLSMLVNIPAFLLDSLGSAPSLLCAVIGPLSAAVLQGGILYVAKDNTFFDLMGMAAKSSLGKYCPIMQRLFP